MPTTRTPKSSGAIITLMRRRKIVPSNCKLTETEGQSWQNAGRARRPTKIQLVSERRDVAYAAMSRIASQRRSVGSSAGSGSRCVPASNDAAMAIAAATDAAARNLFFIGARRRISSVPKGILVSAACQWKRARKQHAANFDPARRALIYIRHNDLQFLYSERGYSTRNATSGSMRVARRAGR